MKIGVVGSRGFSDYDLLKKTLDSMSGITEIVSGGAKGADSLGADYARENKIHLRVFKPDWNKWGKSAGFRRNRTIVEASDMIVAFWDGKSRGTKHTITIAGASKKPVKIVRYEE